MSESHDIEQIARVIREECYLTGSLANVAARAILPLLASAREEGAREGAKKMQREARKVAVRRVDHEWPSDELSVQARSIADEIARLPPLPTIKEG